MQLCVSGRGVAPAHGPPPRTVTRACLISLLANFANRILLTQVIKCTEKQAPVLIGHLGPRARGANADADRDAYVPLEPEV